MTGLHPAPDAVQVDVRRPNASGAMAVARLTRRRPELMIGVGAVIVTSMFSWVPSLWYDEAATVTSALRTIPQLWAELGTVDAVHGAYYLFMHVWLGVVGYTPFTLRLPSAVAVGVAAALVTVLARRLGGRRLGVVSGLVYVALPRVQWAGSEGRPYAMITVMSVGLALVGLTAARRTRDRSGSARRWWVGYAALAAGAVMLNIYLALAVLALGVGLLWSVAAGGAESDRRAGWAVFRRWLLAAATAGLLMVPFVAVVVLQARQVSWISSLGARTVGQVFATAWFGWSAVYATIGWALMVLAVVAVVRATRQRNTPRDERRMRALRVALPMVVVPTGSLLLATGMGVHLYSPKYASLSLPFVAMLIALALTAVRRRRWGAAAVVAMLLVSIPTAVEVRLPHAKQSTHWAEAAAFVRAHRTAGQEGVYFGSIARHHSATADLIRVSYPAAFAGMRDIGTASSAEDSARLWNRNGPLSDAVHRTEGLRSVWVVGERAAADTAPLRALLRDAGFVDAATDRFGSVRIDHYVR